MTATQASTAIGAQDRPALRCHRVRSGGPRRLVGGVSPLDRDHDTRRCS